MGQGPHGVNKKHALGIHSTRKAIHKTKVRKRLNEKRRKKRKKKHTQQDFDKKRQDSKDISHTDHGISSKRCAKLKKRGLNRKSAKHTINNQCFKGSSKVPKTRSVQKKKQKRRSKDSHLQVRSLPKDLTDKNVPHTSINSMMDRIGSFGQWSERSVRTGPLIDAGFSCKDPQFSLVECKDCEIVLDISELNGKNPLEYHKTVSPSCIFVHEEDLHSTEGHNNDKPNTYVQPSSGQHTNCNSLVPSATNNKPIDTVPVTQNIQNDVLHGACNEQANGNTMQSDVSGILRGSMRNPIYADEDHRRVTFRLWPHRATHDIGNLMNAGLYYTGTEDILRCFYCDIGLAEWDKDDDPWVEHARHSPECSYLKDQKGQDYINNIQTQWARIYTPKHPQYSQMDARRRSYQNAGWPRDNVLQSPEQLAAAGFFYTCVGDCVRCFYCDGGLQEWEPTDDPWVEHARWFPFCKFVLKIKGQRFNQASASYFAASGGLQASAIHPAAAIDSEDTDTLGFVDSCKILEQRNPMRSAAAMSLREFGYHRKSIRLAIKTFVDLTGRRDFKAVDLLDIILDKEDAGQLFTESDEDDHVQQKVATDSGLASTGPQSKVDDDDDDDAAAAAADDDDDLHLAVEGIRKEIEHLKEMAKCKICDGNVSLVVFLPCGHIVTDEKDENETETIPWNVGNGTEAYDDKKL